MFTALEQELQQLDIIGQRRRVSSYVPISASEVEQNGKRYIMMASNDYLGMTHNPVAKEYALKAVQQYGVGSGGARLLSGSFALFEELETLLAKYKHRQSALVFNTGYMANVGTVSALVGKDDIIFSDALNHASIIDGCRLSKAHIVPYRHSDVDHLATLMAEYEPHQGRKLVITDGVFSMDGDIAPLPDLLQVTHRYGGLLMVDDAHATGVLGSGTAHYFGMEQDVPIQLGTLSKAIGSVGGYVAGDQVLIDYLMNKSRSFIFSTALSPADIGASIGALTYMMTHPKVQDTLRSNTQYMTKALMKIGVPANSDTPIFPIVIGENDRTVALSQTLKERGIILSAVRPPTVEVGRARLRLTVTAAHTEEQLHYVIEQLGELL